MRLLNIDRYARRATVVWEQQGRTSIHIVSLLGAQTAYLGQEVQQNDNIAVVLASFCKNTQAALQAINVAWALQLDLAGHVLTQMFAVDRHHLWHVQKQDFH